MKKKLINELWVYRCKKNQPKHIEFGLNVSKRYKKGDFVTPYGEPSKQIMEASIVNPNEPDHYDLRSSMAECEYDDVWGDQLFDEYFEIVKIKVKAPK